MIIRSQKNQEKYYWVKIPRTGTVSFQMLFELYGDCELEKDAKEGEHRHYYYKKLCEMYNETLPGVTVVRHPLTRFISILYYMVCSHTYDPRHNENYNIHHLWESTDSCVSFLNTWFDRNLELKAPSLSTFFTTNNIKHSKSYNAFFTTQAQYAYHPKVKIFHFEKMYEFEHWIEDTLGFDVTKLEKTNTSCKNHKVGVDFTSPYFIKTIENLFYIDYKLFDYPLQYLT